MFVAAIAAGATSLGVDVHVVGVVPTPALAFLAGTGPFAAGIMVSASHNPADDNGLKVLDARGLKLDDAIEDELEPLIWRTEELGGVAQRRARPDDRRDGALSTTIGPPAGARAADRRAAACASSSMRANGSGCVVGPEILAATGARVEVIHAEPDGVNINVRCGATAPGVAGAEAVVAAGADAGFALDGDADRLIAVDAAGRVVDGDQVLGILALDRLAPRTRCPAAASSCRSSRTAGSSRSSRPPAARSSGRPVGDKYILEGMQVSGAVLGGEKSGHVIVLEHTTSGDGIVTALEVLRVMAGEGRRARRARGARSRCCHSNSAR